MNKNELINKKISTAILTIQDVNFGNRLQNFATQEKLKELGYSVETLDDISETVFIQKIKNKVKGLINFNSKSNNHDKPFSNERRNIFSEWNDNYINYSDFQISRYYIPINLGKKYDYFIVGSDQVWNPHFRKDTMFLMPFVKKEQSVAYAASFGVSILPEEQKTKYSKHLLDFKAISVRESSGSKIVNDLIGCHPDVVVDPTMLLTKEEWLSFEKKPDWFDGQKYILTYSLGGLPPKIEKRVKELSEERGYRIIEILNPNNKDWYTIDPFEFIYLINHSELIVTDSFHGSVFSILFERPFFVFDRSDFHESMNSRIETLLNTFNLEKHFFKEDKSSEDIFEINYEHVPEILNKKRAIGVGFLTNNLNK